MTVAIIDYGSGNLRSAAKAFERAAADCRRNVELIVTDDPARVAAARHIVLPGVGAFADCMRGLAAIPGMIEALTGAVIAGGRPFLGICVGMQLMATTGLEHGAHDGLGWIEGEVAPLGPLASALKIPHMGWNELEIRAPDHPVLAGFVGAEHAYFVHSYAFRCADPGRVLATTEYGGKVAAIIGRDNLVGTQFHPEKSQATGLLLIRNFLNWRP
jgi:imidazole glycerol-phosphate synthase subunit HisH